MTLGMTSLNLVELLFILQYHYVWNCRLWVVFKFLGSWGVRPAAKYLSSVAPFMPMFNGYHSWQTFFRLHCNHFGFPTRLTMFMTLTSASFFLSLAYDYFAFCNRYTSMLIHLNIVVPVISSPWNQCNPKWRCRKWIANQYTLCDIMKYIRQEN